MATVCQNITSEQMDTPFTGASEKESHFCGILIEKGRISFTYSIST